MKINEWPRHGIQALWAFITNSHVTGFVTGKIYTGKLKNACVPGLNCYSCPGAAGLPPAPYSGNSCIAGTHFLCG